MHKKTLLGAGLALSLFGLTACGDAGQDADREPTSAEQSDAQESQQPPAPEPDLEGIPDVVAEVNGQEIDRAEFVAAYESQFEQMAMQAQLSGQEIDQDQLKQSTAENLVGTQLLIQEADDRGFIASAEQVDDTLQEMAQSNGLESGDEVIAALVEQGMAEDEVMTQLERQVKVDQLVAEEAGDIEPTEAELRQLYDQSVAQQEQAAGEGGQAAEIPPFEDVKPQLEQQVTSQKEAEAVQALVGTLRESADVTIHL